MLFKGIYFICAQNIFLLSFLMHFLLGNLAFINLISVHYLLVSEIDLSICLCILFGYINQKYSFMGSKVFHACKHVTMFQANESIITLTCVEYLLFNGMVELYHVVETSWFRFLFGIVVSIPQAQTPHQQYSHMLKLSVNLIRIILFFIFHKNAWYFPIHLLLYCKMLLY